MTTFVLGQDIDSELATAAFKAAIRTETRLENRVMCQAVASGNTLGIDAIIQKEGIENVVPVGGMEFVQEFCREHGIAPLEALNLPDELLFANDIPLGRNIWRDLNKSDFAQLPPEMYLIKPGKTPKRFDGMFYRSDETVPSDVIPDDEPLFVQSFIRTRFWSRWRLFILHGDIIAMRPYYMDDFFWTVPHSVQCRAMAELLSKYHTIALDVAVIANGSETPMTIPIEAHTFLACELYGWQDPELLHLAKIAWRVQCQKNQTGTGGSQPIPPDHEQKAKKQGGTRP